jgi:hypothetical protein
VVLRREATRLNAAYIQKPLVTAADLLAALDAQDDLTPPRTNRQTATSGAR